MNRRLPLALVLGLLVAALGWTGWEAGQEHREIILLRARLNASDLALEQARKQVVQDRNRVAEAAKKRAENRKAKQEAAAGAAKSGDKKDGPVDLTPYLEKLPGYAQLHHLQMLRQINRQYGDLKELNLPPDQLDKLRTLLGEKLQAPQDAREAALHAGIEPNSPEMRQAMQSATEGIQDEIKALVSPDQLATINNLQSQSMFRNVIQYQYAPDMTAAGLSLTSTQISALAQAQADAQKTAAEAVRNGGGGTDFQTVMNQAMADQAAKILTPDQLPVFQQSLSMSQQMSALQAQARAAAQQELGYPVHSWTMRGGY